MILTIELILESSIRKGLGLNPVAGWLGEFSIRTRSHPAQNDQHLQEKRRRSVSEGRLMRVL